MRYTRPVDGPSKKMDWSGPQREALTFEQSTMVRAVAGSGKTATLVELFTRLLLGEFSAKSAVPAHELAAITFTNLAAAEMHSRLRSSMAERLSEALKADKDDRTVRAAMAVLHQVRISTIHGLCRRLLTEHPLESGYDPQSRILEDREAAQLRGRILSATLHRSLDALDSHTRRWLHRIGLMADSQRSYSAVGWLSGILVNICQAGIEPGECRVLYESDRAAEQNFSDGFRQFFALREELLPGLHATKYKVAKDFLEQLSVSEAALQSAIEMQDWPSLAERFSQVAGAGLTEKGTVRARLPEPDRVLALCKQAEILTSLCWERVAAPTVMQIYDWLDQAYNELEAWKMANAAWEHQDLVLLARRLLQRNPEIQGEWRQRLQVLFVDEFQDTDPVQIDIILRLSGIKEESHGPRRRLFVVGDPRQAIYGFRGADFKSYLDFSESWEREKTGALLDFPHIRRSHPALVGFFNALMSHAYQSTGLDRRHHGSRPIKAARMDADLGPRAVWLRPSEDEDAWSDREWEAATIAQEIQTLLQSGRFAAKDIAVLMRTRRHLSHYERALARCGIPYAVHKGTGYHDGFEISDALNAWGVFLRPGDALSLAALLRSPMVGLDDPSLFALGQMRIEGEEAGVLHQGRWTDPEIQQRMLEACTSESRDELVHFFAWASPLWQARSSLTLAQILERVLESTDYFAWLLTDPQGPQRTANLKKLIESARAFERSGRLPAEWPDELEERISASLQDTQAALHEPKGQSATLATIHGAKGLEWKVVFMAGLDSEGRNSAKPGWDYLKELGVGVAAIDAKGIEHESYRLRAIREQRKQREREESLRLFYVGITRAEDWLYLSGCPPKRHGSNAGSWFRLVEDLAGDPAANGLLESRVVTDPGTIEAQRHPEWGNLGDRLRAVSMPVADLDATRPLAIPFTRPEPREKTVAVTALADRLFCARYAGWKRLGDQALPAAAEDEESRAPEIEAAVLGATESGRLIHAMLDAAELDADPDVRRQRMVARAMAQYGLAVERLTAKERERVEQLAGRAERWIEAASPEWQAQEVRPQREWPFLIQLDVATQPLLVRGVIDLWTLGPDGPQHLIDFKLAQPKEPGTTLHSYQLGVYAWALKHIQGSLPREIRIEYLVEPQQSVSVDARETVALLDSSEFQSMLAGEPQSSDDEGILALTGRDGSWCAAKKCPHFTRCHGFSPPA